MRFMIMVLTKNTESEEGPPPDVEAFARMDRFNEEMVRAGVALAYDGLQPTSKGARLEFSAGGVAVTDGPFTETKELVAGYWLIRVKSRDDAIAWMKRAPFGDGTRLEMRELFEMDDFSALDPTGELRTTELELQTIMKANRG